MSRLYSWIRSDSRKTTLTMRGHEEIDAQINWGSRGNTMLAGRMRVLWERGKEKPTLYIVTGDVNVVMEKGKTK